jgi:transcriptional regulator with XRE-family HTH domain
MEPKKIYGHRLKEFRKFLKKTLKDFAKETGLSNSNISRIERGEIFPNFEFLSNLQKKFDLNLNWVNLGIGSMFLNKGEKESFDIRIKYPGIPNDNTADDLLNCLQVPVIYYYLAAIFIPLKKKHQSLIDEYFEEKEVQLNVG